MTESDSFPQPVEPRPARRAGGLMVGFILVALGVVFLLQSFGWLAHGNWWAIFIFIPALGALGGTLAIYQRVGRFNAAVRGSLGGGLIILTVALMFLFGLDWSVWWPLMLILPGFAIALNGFVDRDTRFGLGFRALTQMNLWIGAAVMLLGLAFLLNGLHVISLRLLFGSFRWWSLCILLPGLGALWNAAWVTLSEKRLTVVARGLLVAGIAACAVAVVAALGLNWNWLAPIILISAGVVMLLGFGEKA